ncbi:hypothetical protein F5Y14DRAFT_446255 [Nemania sp. NC0429]|nr:hypothetical protein F5Y14DRAFT_446255 [Nemania sp. NC0429]
MAPSSHEIPRVGWPYFEHPLSIFHNMAQNNCQLRKEIRKCMKTREGKEYKPETESETLPTGEDKAEADKFWDDLKSDGQIQDVLYMTEDILDEKFQAKSDQKELEIWLLTTLLSPMQSLLS